MSAIAKNPPVLRCRDCGETIRDDATIKRASVPRHRSVDAFTVADNGKLMSQVTLPGACTRCGGGRFVVDDGGVVADRDTIRALTRRGDN